MMEAAQPAGAEYRGIAMLGLGRPGVPGGGPSRGASRPLAVARNGLVAFTQGVKR
jgi:hypothetical protein